MTQTYALTQTAKSDLQKIWHYSFHQWGEEQATTYLNQLEDAFVMLGENPSLGRIQYRYGDDVHVFKAKYHLIFYITMPDSLTVFAILHEKMDVLRRLQHRLKEEL